MVGAALMQHWAKLGQNQTKSDKNGLNFPNLRPLNCIKTRSTCVLQSLPLQKPTQKEYTIDGTTLTGLQPARDKPSWFLVNRLNHSATVSWYGSFLKPIYLYPGWVVDDLAETKPKRLFYILWRRFELRMVDSKSTVITTSLSEKHMEIGGVEPPTFCMQSRRATTVPYPLANSCKSFKHNTRLNFKIPNTSI